MGRLTTLTPRVKPAEGRKLAPLTEGEPQRGWGSGRGGRPWRRKREAILVRDQYTCRCCGLVTTELEIDHIVNLARGGTDTDDNLQALCGPCHKEKTAKEAAAGAGRW